MSDPKSPAGRVLGLRAGDWVEVRSTDEILATLDDRGQLDALPFMPEMLQYCGRRFRVFKSAHKTCDTIAHYDGRRMTNAVHLEGLRCDGEAHGGCQAGCLLFWKEAWLKRVTQRDLHVNPVELASGTRPAAKEETTHRDLRALQQNTRTSAAEGDSAERYTCQATELLRATAPLKWWDPRQYVKDLTSRNLRFRDFVRYGMIALYNLVMRSHWRGRPYPNVRGLAKGKTPIAVLNLQPGDLVQVRSKDEIMPTLNAGLKNRGLSFDVEMVPYCGKKFRVLRRVERIINEKNGVMIRMPTACIILEGVTCSGCFSDNRLFCPRSIYPYWHEIWLKRVE
jgi:hypothetical protein